MVERRNGGRARTVCDANADTHLLTATWTRPILRYVSRCFPYFPRLFPSPHPKKHKFNLIYSTIISGIHISTVLSHVGSCKTFAKSWERSGKRIASENPAKPKKFILKRIGKITYCLVKNRLKKSNDSVKESPANKSMQSGLHWFQESCCETWLWPCSDYHLSWVVPISFEIWAGASSSCCRTSHHAC